MSDEKRWPPPSKVQPVLDAAWLAGFEAARAQAADLCEHGGMSYADKPPIAYDPRLVAGVALRTLADAIRSMTPKKGE